MINDNKFIKNDKVVTNQYNKYDLNGITNQNKWDAIRLASMLSNNSNTKNCKFKYGEKVKFTTPDGNNYIGKIAIVSGNDYVVEVSDGESYLVPENKLSSININKNDISNIIKRELMPRIDIISEPKVKLANRCTATIRYIGNEPSDRQLLEWSKDTYPNMELIDVNHIGNQKLALIFEVHKDAAEDVKPQGGDQNTRGIPLSSEEKTDNIFKYMKDIIDRKKIDKYYISGYNQEDPIFSTNSFDDAVKVLNMYKEEDPDVEFKLLDEHGDEIDINKVSYIHMNDIHDTINMNDIVKNSSSDYAGYIKKEKGKYCVKSKTNKDWSGGCYDTKEEAEKRLKQVEMFKHMSSATDDLNNDLKRAAEWVLSRFNDNNPEYYAIPKEYTTINNDETIVRLSFILKKKNGDNLNDIYITKGGKLTSSYDNSSHTVNGYVQVDSNANLPVMIINTPLGDKSIQDFGFNFTAKNLISKLASDYDSCINAANEILDMFGGYTADAHAEFNARLIKLGVDKKTKEYWSNYFKDYGKMWVRDINKKKKKSASISKIAVDDLAKEYWINYFGSSNIRDDAWYGKLLVRDISDIKKQAANKDIQIDEYNSEVIVTTNDGRKWITSYYYEPEQKGGPQTEPIEGGFLLDSDELVDEDNDELLNVDEFENKYNISYDDIINAIKDHFEQNAEYDMYYNAFLVDFKYAMKKHATDIESVFKVDKRRKYVTQGGPLGGDIDLRDVKDIATWAVDIADTDQDMYRTIHNIVYKFLTKYPGFMMAQRGKPYLTDAEDVGYVLTYAIANSKRVFNKLKKQINKYMKRWQNNRWKEIEQSNKNWRIIKKKKDDNQNDEELVIDEQPQQEQSQQVQQEQSTQQEEQVNPWSWLNVDEEQQEQEQMKQTSASVYNKPGKDDKKDYNYKNRRKQPAKNMMKFKLTSLYSTSSSSDNGYIFMDIGWDPDIMLDLSDQNIQQQIISFVKGLESNKEYHDFGVMGRIRIIDFARNAGVARVKVRCSETRNVPTMGYSNINNPIPINGIR